jgi:hypothetical protein
MASQGQALERLALERLERNRRHNICTNDRGSGCYA